MKASTNFLGLAVAAALGGAPAGAWAQATQAVQGTIADAEKQAIVEKYSDDIQELARSVLLEWIQDRIIIDAIKEQNIRHETMTMEEVLRLDKIWIAQAKNKRNQPMIADLLDRLHSILLRDKRETSGGLVTEIIVMDMFGLNAAISDPTSDYYQGDEAKYQDTYLVGPDAVHVSDLYFDDSTQEWQTQVSLPVVDPDNPRTPIGAVTFGINLDALEAN